MLTVLAALAFTVGGVFMKYADGLRNTWASVLFLVMFGIGAVLQSQAMRGGELGVIYILVLGLEAALAFGFGTIIFGEAVTLTKIVAILLIVSGIALLRMP
jgi:small multidrug resistance pump/quaternary ammonium compound-resistance protein SugE